jgi:hypothetical protein
MQRLTIIVGGFIGILPAGGVTWDYIQYPLGFHEMGHDVYYIEDTRLYPIYQKEGSNWDDASSSVSHLQQVMRAFGFDGRWAYRDEASGKCFGLSEKEVKNICRKADIFVNISCSTFLRDEYLSIPVRILIDSDPMFTQIQYVSGQAFTSGKPAMVDLISNHNYYFTFGENIGSDDCLIPTCDLQWYATRQPICLKYWPVTSLPANGQTFTTLMNWSAGKKLCYRNKEWGQKDEEFNKIIHLPQLVSKINLSIAVSQTNSANGFFPKEAIQSYGWEIVEPGKIAGDWRQYSQFIGCSTGEFSVAKQTYVKAKTGWFSCRSACYLAAGRPVVVQDTGWSKFIPSGEGVLAFDDMQSAADALERVVADKEHHARKAREIAEEYFDSTKVLNSMLEIIS